MKNKRCSRAYAMKDLNSQVLETSVEGIARITTNFYGALIQDPKYSQGGRDPSEAPLPSWIHQRWSEISLDSLRSLDGSLVKEGISSFPPGKHVLMITLWLRCFLNWRMTSWRL